MVMDFNLVTYKLFLEALLKAKYTFVKFSDYISASPDGNCIVLRHDVDALPNNSLDTAKIEFSLGIVATYYFRAVPESWDESVILQIAGFGHEVGYHYESLTTCGGDVEAAYSDFTGNLRRLRQLVPVTSICMHGSPLSPYDSKEIWKKYDYRSLGIEGEPYLDVDFSNLFYMTDTGRRWDGFKVSVRDRIPTYQDVWRRNGLVFHSTEDVIGAIRSGRFPNRAMITTHPQRWTDDRLLWIKEFILQNIKNKVKRLKLLFCS